MGGGSIAWADTSFYGEALELSGQLGLIFYLQNGNTQPSGTMTFTITPGNTTHMLQNPTETRTETIDGANVTLYGYMCPVTSIEMADTITASFTPSSGTVNSRTNSVQGYLNTIINDNTETYKTNLKNLAKAIKAYGYYAQQTLSETKGWTKGTDHTQIGAPTDTNGAYDAITASSTAVTTYASDAMTLTYKGTGSEPTTAPTVGLTLDLDAKTTLHVILPEGSYVNSDTDVTTDNANLINMKESTSTYVKDMASRITITPADTTNRATSTVDIAFSDISAHELADKFVIPVTILVDSTRTAYEIEVSAMSYVHSVLSQSNTDLNTKVEEITTDDQAGNLKQAVIALANYYNATVAYRANPDN